jgi:HEAT repeat protein
LPLAQLGLEDENAAVRFAALVTIGKLGFDHLGEAVEPLLNDGNASVRAAAMFAARQCGRKVNISQMARMLGSSDPTLRGNVAMLVGLMGDASAVPMLAEQSKRSLRRASPAQQAVVRVQVAEARVRLGDEGALDALRAGAFSAYDEVRILAVTALGEAEDRRMLAALQQILLTPPMQVQLAAAGTLARLGLSDGLSVALEAAALDGQAVAKRASAALRETQDEGSAAVWRQLASDPAQCQAMAAAVRSQAAFVLGQIGGAEAQAALGKLLGDELERVRLSAAAAVLRSSGGELVGPAW